MTDLTYKRQKWRVKDRSDGSKVDTCRTPKNRESGHLEDTKNSKNHAQKLGGPKTRTAESRLSLSLTDENRPTIVSGSSVV